MSMIPKIIHYCWFGRNPLPKSAKKCIASWKKYLPDYEIKEWNEDNFNIDMLPYTRDAYDAKKYAFVSDYARFWVLYKYGGVYFDTDVEAVKSMDDIIEKGAFMGWETANENGTPKIAPGLGLATPAGHPLYKEILDKYQDLSFYKPDGSFNNYTMIPLVTDLLVGHGLKIDGTFQVISDTHIYPSDYFCPMNSITGIVTLTENTRTIHWYSMSWVDKKTQRNHKIAMMLRRFLGDSFVSVIKRLFKKA